MSRLLNLTSSKVHTLLAVPPVSQYDSANCARVMNEPLACKNPLVAIVVTVSLSSEPAACAAGIVTLSLFLPGAVSV